MTIWIDAETVDKYTLKADRDTEGAAVFHLAPLDVREYEERKDLITGRESDGQVTMKLGAWVYFTLKRGLRDIEHAPFEVTRDPDGRVSDEVLSRITPNDRSELAGRIDKLSHMGRDDLKD